MLYDESRIFFLPLPVLAFMTGVVERGGDHVKEDEAGPKRCYHPFPLPPQTPPPPSSLFLSFPFPYHLYLY